MDAADQQRATVSGLTIGDAMVVDTAPAGRWARGCNVGKAKLRSQDVELALVSMPAEVGRPAETIVSSSKRIVRSIHTTLLTTRVRATGDRYTKG